MESESNYGYESHQSKLERVYIKEYLLQKGFSWEDVQNLPKDEAKRLMDAAIRYASLKLAEHEARAKLRQKIRIE